MNERNVNEALFRFDRASLVINQREAVGGQNAIELVVYNGVNLRNKRTDTASDLRGLNLFAPGGQLPREGESVAGHNVVEALVHNVIGFCGRRGQRNKPERALVRDRPVAAITRTYPAQNLLHGVTLRERDHIIQTAIDAGSRVDRCSNAVCNLLNNGGHGFRPFAFVVLVVNHGL